MQTRLTLDPSVSGLSVSGQGERSQQTLRSPVRLAGVGLHSGQTTQVQILPAPVDAGRYFVRVDQPNQPMIPAHINALDQTTLSTELRQGEAKVRTVEHLLASLWALGIDNARIEIDGAEVPLLDGSAQVWTEAIRSAGLSVQASDRPVTYLTEPIWVRPNDQSSDLFVAALPSPVLRFTYGIEFDVSAIGKQWHSWQPDGEDFATDIAPARTFGLAHQIEQLRQAGLIQGGSLENALVCSHEGWINPPLRFSNEPVRHKLLDLVGDLSLVSPLPIAHYLAYKASHQLHTQLARQLQSIAR
jgi:UDP-3-O-[3-hydroxymyristoyl] N-acetylglucosamine deacetylase